MVAVAQQAGVTVPKSVAELIERFGSQRTLLHASPYNETQLRREFLDPFLEALGWDVSNRNGVPEPFKDVIHEDALKVGATIRAPDYCLRVGGERRLFIEAKKPAVNVGDAASPAFQLRRYAWSAKLPLGILTDFEQMAIYDSRVEPQPTDGPAVARVTLLSYRDYEEQWPLLWSLFSRDAVYGGSLEQYIRENKEPRGTLTVDRAFLREIEHWRTALAVDIARRNVSLTARELNFAVQRTLDRIIFLRICEDRGIERYGVLGEVAAETDIYRRLLAVFREADVRYNAGLFQFTESRSRVEGADGLTPRLVVGDDALQEIVRRLYYPSSPYEFSVIPAEILGQVYEQFLGRVIVLSSQHEASVEEKPEVRKAGGVYYTPSFIADYIVRRTLGPLLAGQKVGPRRRPQVRVLDPACGSGSFLIVAYQFMLDWYLAQYSIEPERNPKAVYKTAGGWRLTMGERKRILLDHIFGVDVDSQAVETTKLSLLLKVLEGESAETVGQNLRLFAEPALPDLGSNIKAGNALVETDFYEHQMSLIRDEYYELNPFSWQNEFPDVFTGVSPGFDAVIGNPPYLSYSGRQAVELDPSVRDYLMRRYEASGWPTSHGFFIENAAKQLSRGFISFVVPDQVGHLAGYGDVRRILGENAHVVEVKYWGEDVFAGVTTPSLTFVADRRTSGDTSSVIDRRGGENETSFIDGQAWTASSHHELHARLVANSFSLGKLVADPGVHTGNCSKKLILPNEAATPDAVPVLEGKQVGRYSCAVPTKVLRLGYEADPGEYFTIRPIEKYEAAEFVIRQTAAYPIVGPRRHAAYFRNSLLALYSPKDVDVRYVVGVLNSSLMRWIYKSTVTEAGQLAFPQVKVAAIRALPIREVGDDWSLHDAIVRDVDALLKLMVDADEVRTEQESVALGRRAAAMDRAIDASVYSLYGVTESEVSMIQEDLIP